MSQLVVGVKCDAYNALDDGKRLRGKAPVLSAVGVAGHVMAFEATIGNKRVLVLLDEQACGWLGV